MPTILAKQWNDLGVGFDPNDSEISISSGLLLTSLDVIFASSKDSFSKLTCAVINQLDTIDMDVILTARELLVFGNE